MAATKEVALIEHYSRRYLSDKDRQDMLNKVSLQFWTTEACEICAQATTSCDHCQICKDTRSCPTCKAAEAREPRQDRPHQRSKARGSTAVSPHPSVEEEEEGQTYPKASRATLDKNLVMPANLAKIRAHQPDTQACIDLAADDISAQLRRQGCDLSDPRAAYALRSMLEDPYTLRHAKYADNKGHLRSAAACDDFQQLKTLLEEHLSTKKAERQQQAYKH